MRRKYETSVDNVYDRSQAWAYGWTTLPYVGVDVRLSIFAAHVLEIDFFQRAVEIARHPARTDANTHRGSLGEGGQQVRQASRWHNVIGGSMWRLAIQLGVDVQLGAATGGVKGSLDNVRGRRIGGECRGATGG